MLSAFKSFLPLLFIDGHEIAQLITRLPVKNVANYSTWRWLVLTTELFQPLSTSPLGGSAFQMPIFLKGKSCQIANDTLSALVFNEKVQMRTKWKGWHDSPSLYLMSTALSVDVVKCQRPIRLSLGPGGVEIDVHWAIGHSADTGNSGPTRR
jgi:hypothetical protein